MKDVITLGAGCFWGVQEILKGIPGVLKTRVGYAGGHTSNPTYEDICKGNTGHAEVVQVEFDTQILPLPSLLDLFFRLHDPTQLNQQGHDVGTQYRSVIFYHDTSQRTAAEAALQEQMQSGRWPKPIVTEIVAAATFTLAEEEHQDYLEKNPGGYTCHFVRN